MIDLINGFAEGWWSWAVALSLQVAVLGALLWLADRVVGKRIPVQIRYAAWALVFVRLLLPPSLYLPTSISANLPPVPTAARAAVDGAASPAAVAPVMSVETAELAPAGNAPPLTARGRAVPTWKAFLFVSWVAVAAILFCVLWRRSASVMRSSAVGRTPPAKVSEMISECAARLGLRRRLPAIITDKAPGIALLGVFRPVILLPEDAIEEASDEQLRHMLLHELAHVKRRDPVVNAFLTLLHMAFWFHPLVWIAGKRLRNLREFCCDVTVSTLLREDTAMYRETLLSVARKISAPARRPALGLLGLFENRDSLSARLDQLKKPLWKYARRDRILALLAGAALFVLLVPMARSRAESSQAPTATTTAPESTLPAAAALMCPLAGIILDEAGRPVEGAIVEAHATTTIEPPSAVSDTDGRFRMDIPVKVQDKTNIRTLMAKSSSGICFEETYWHPGRSEFKPVEMVLTPPDGAVAGRVVDDLGNGVAGVTVEVVNLHRHIAADLLRMVFLSDLDRIQAMYRVRTSDDGRFRVEGLPRLWDKTELSLRADSIVPVWVLAEVSPSDEGEQAFTVQLAGRIEGRVIVSDPGLSTDGLQVLARNTSREGGKRTSVDRVIANGKFVLTSVPPGDCYVRVLLGKDVEDEWVCKPVVLRDLKKGETVWVSVEIVKGAPITGRLLHADTGEPMPDGGISARLAGFESPVYSGRGGRVDDDGRFIIYVPPGLTHELVFSALDPTGKSVKYEQASMEVRVDSAAPIDVGDIRLKNDPPKDAVADGIAMGFATSVR